jgi:pimeloyl-ACP methyl ester carboxylesterase
MRAGRAAGTMSGLCSILHFCSGRWSSLRFDTTDPERSSTFVGDEHIIMSRDLGTGAGVASADLPRIRRGVAKRRTRRSAAAIIIALLLSACTATARDTGDALLHRTSVNGAELHYTDRGAGAPVIFVHGGLEDYQSWSTEMLDSLARHYRVITYSRRYNYPNRNPVRRDGFSAATEAEDLAGLIRKLGLGPVHVVGHSFGGLTALFLATKEPELVRTLVLSEPAVTAWLPDLPGGESLYQDFSSTLRRVRESFEKGDQDGVLRTTLAYFAGADVLDQIPPASRAVLTRNLPEWEAIAFAPEAFADPHRGDVERIKAPVLLITGDSTLPLLRLINGEVERVLPRAKRVRIAKAGHELWETHTDLARRTVAEFLASH